MSSNYILCACARDAEVPTVNMKAKQKKTRWLAAIRGVNKSKLSSKCKLKTRRVPEQRKNGKNYYEVCNSLIKFINTINSIQNMFT